MTYDDSKSKGWLMGNQRIKVPKVVILIETDTGCVQRVRDLAPCSLIVFGRNGEYPIVLDEDIDVLCSLTMEGVLSTDRMRNLGRVS